MLTFFKIILSLVIVVIIFLSFPLKDFIEFLSVIKHIHNEKKNKKKYIKSIS